MSREFGRIRYDVHEAYKHSIYDTEVLLDWNSGLHNANSSYTLNKRGHFIATPPAGKIGFLTDLHLEIRDGAAPTGDAYGGIPTLVTGWELFIDTGTTATIVRYVLPQGLTIQSNAGLGIFFDEVNIYDFTTGDDFVQAHREFIVPVLVAPGERLVWRLNDDLSGLTEHTMVGYGYTYTPRT